VRFIVEFQVLGIHAVTQVESMGGLNCCPHLLINSMKQRLLVPSK
jgi:hypothetical protein